ncbi:MAG: tRNA epoxyqueuosine(34) reductase QueG [Candidatus Rokubacteria bacterium]|nr:tRNA epoxyqueuosine(34) reductase QueG [Candidatus Rokubacteria bacterium]
MTLVGLALSNAVKARALEVGFDRVAIGPAAPPEHAGAFERWLDAGYAGSMSYLARTRVERGDPSRWLPGARSVVTVALSYNSGRDAPEARARAAGRERPHRRREGHVGGRGPSGWRNVARYARGRDYHDVMRPKLAALVDLLGEAGGPDVESRAAVDTSAVLERDLAARAGLGWVGKNTNLLDEALGSYFFIGAVVTTADLELDSPVPDRCGTCTACLDACPTQAFVAPYVLDARRCISYLTIEHRGAIDGALRPAIADWLFGCDVCQDVCPWNRKARPAQDPSFLPVTDLDPPEKLLALDDASFRARFRGTALIRPKRAGLLRNAALVLGNRGDSTSIAALRGAVDDADRVVSDAARWALAHLEASAAVMPASDVGEPR